MSINFRPLSLKAKVTKMFGKNAWEGQQNEPFENSAGLIKETHRFGQGGTLGSGGDGYLLISMMPFLII
jgi:hypothetical protein